ncbi:MAG: regulatory protein RecX [Gemmatimonadales bacterium]
MKSVPARRITGLEPDPAHPGSVRVFVDGKLFCTIGEEAVGGAGLEVGEPWDGTRAGVAGEAADLEAAWRSLLRALERRSFATGELRRKLRRNGHPATAVDLAVERALRVQLLDDAAYVNQYVASRSARGRGPSRLRRDLAALGIDRGTIDAAIAAQWPEPEDALGLARELAQRRARQLAAQPRDVRRRRILAYLARRGFTGAKVADLVRLVLSVEGAGVEG